jgi:serine/threonine protein kinase
MEPDIAGYTIQNHLRCQHLGLHAPHLYHCHNLDDIVIIETEYIPGKDLLDYLNDNRRTILPVKKILTELIAHVHSYQKHQLSHLDLKLENIIWDEHKQEFRIIDFEAMRVHPRRGFWDVEVSLGTSNCMSPEMLFGCKIHRNTDLWNVGLVGYMLVMRHNPLYDKATDRQWLQWYAKHRLHTANVDAELANLIVSLLHADPERRSTRSSMHWFPIIPPIFVD